jgi:hypothetical protein
MLGDFDLADTGGPGGPGPGTLTAAALTSACDRILLATFGYTTQVTGLPGVLGLLSAAQMFC